MSDLQTLLHAIKGLSDQIASQEKKQDELQTQLEEIRHENKEIRRENKDFRDEMNHTWNNFTEPLLYYNVGTIAASMYHNLDKGECLKSPRLIDIQN